MGFLGAVRSLGGLHQEEGLESYLSFPLEKGGKMIRVALQVTDKDAEPLDVCGVAWIDLAEQKMESAMKKKYLYRNRVGSAATWGFSPIHKMGKPKKNVDINREQIMGKNGDWENDKNCHLNKIKNKLLLDFEKENAFTPGSVERIMVGLAQKIEDVLPYLDHGSSHIFLFGIDDGNGTFLYPGDIQSFLHYFQKKLDSSLQKGEEEKIRCAYCRATSSPYSMSKIFKFSTGDKVNIYHGLDKREEPGVFPICENCFERISSGRDRLHIKLNYSSVLPKINIWILPEEIHGEGGRLLQNLIRSLEENISNDRLKSIGEKRETQYFSWLAREGKGLIFHFIFWEKNNAQELVHLMVEDVPPERLALLEKKWGEAVQAVFGQVSEEFVALDWAIKSLYKTLSGFAGKSDGDKGVFRDYALKVIGKLFRGERLPVDAFKQAIVRRAARLVFETAQWSDVSREFLYALAWVEFMNRMNQEAVK